jgi:hypothetical protein
MAGGQNEDRTGCPFCSFFEQFQEAEVHVLNAKREILMAVRAIIEHEIEMTKRSMEKRGAASKAEKVEIE